MTSRIETIKYRWMIFKSIKTCLLVENELNQTIYFVIINHLWILKFFFKMCRHWKTNKTTKRFLQMMIVVIKKNLHEQFKRNFINFYYKCVFEWIAQIRCFFQTIFVFYLNLNWHRWFFKIETMKRNLID